MVFIVWNIAKMSQLCPGEISRVVRGVFVKNDASKILSL